MPRPFGRDRLAGRSIGTVPGTLLYELAPRAARRLLDRTSVE
jgi:hypothetical protein